MIEPAAPPFALPTDATPIAEAAELYAAAGLPPVPVWGLAGGGRCACHAGACGKPGKHPIGNSWQARATLDVDDVRDRFRSHRGNIGIYLGLNRLVLIDADGQLGLDTAATWQLPLTLTQQSGSGVGAHYIYRFAPHQDASLVTDRSKFAPGLDVKASGQFVAAPSRHASGGVYRWTVVQEPTVLPDWLFDRIRKPERLPPATTVAPSVGGDVAALEKRARKYVDRIEPAISGSGGHTRTFAAARAIRAFIARGLPESVGWSILVDYNARCQPPWSERELAHKFEQSKSATHVPEIADRPRLYAIQGGAAAPMAPVAHDADGVVPDALDVTDDGSADPPDGPPRSGPPGPPTPPPDPDWRMELLWAEGKKGTSKLVTHVDNVVRILQLAPEWRGRIRFDAFRSRITITDPPWDEYQRPSNSQEFWNDRDATRMHAWMRRKFHREQFCPSIMDCDRSVAVVAHAHAFNPVRDYLTACRDAYDGTPRLASWVSTYLGVDPGEYARLVGSWWLISAVARIFRPGEKVDTVPILEGEQGIMKSTALKTLAGAEFFNDTPIDIGSKDAMSAIQGCWFVELAELDSLVRAGPTKSKTFFSSSKDHFRKAYARHEEDELRQCIFVGTTNLVEYLYDPTGARRYHPMLCTHVDLDALARDRDQLWGEAVVEYESGRQWYPTSAAERELLGEQQEKRTGADAWEGKVRTWLRAQRRTEATPEEILMGALDIAPKDWTHQAQTRLGIVMMTNLKWVKRRPTVNGVRRWVYEAPYGWQP